MKYSDSPLTVGAVIVCAGKGSRAGLGYNKILHILGSKTVVETTLDAFDGKVDKIVLVVSTEDEDRIHELISPYDGVSLCIGGQTRFDSVYSGLKCVGDCDVVLIHDGARPFVTDRTIYDCIRSAARFGSGIAAVPAVDTIKVVRDGKIAGSLDRSTLVNVQTPQAFIYKDILSAYEREYQSGAARKNTYTDDSDVYAAAGFTPVVVEGSYGNKKITTPDDLFCGTPNGAHIGTGFDVHELGRGRKLILGGTEIPYELGLIGHSDADVLTHAVMDALLSAAGLPDIGVLFPDTSTETEGISSMILLERVRAMLDERNYKISSISAVIIAQKPKLASYIPQIKRSLASALDIAVDRQINVSATTTEHLGIIGEGRAVAASATCLLNEKS